MNDKKPSQSPEFLTKDTVKDFHDSYDDLGLSAYDIATEQLCARLRVIVKSKNDFESLKKELLELLNERETFSKFLWDKYDLDTGKYQL